METHPLQTNRDAEKTESLQLALRMKKVLNQGELTPHDDSSSCGDSSEGSDDSAVWGLKEEETGSGEDDSDDVTSGQTTKFRSQPDDHDQFLEDIFKLIMKDIVSKAGNRQEKVIEWAAPEELTAILDLEPRPDGENHEQLLNRIKDVIKFSVRTGHPHFVNQLFSSLDPYGLAGQLVTDALNCSAYTYEVAPVFTVMELSVLAKMRQLVGYEGGDGIFAPGGSISNIIAVSCARQMAFPETKKRGLFGLPELVVYTSELSHYSIRKAGCLLGLGEDNVRLLKTDPKGRIVPEDLEKQIEETKQQGARPLMVVATAGTTVFGAFDPINDIADICVAHGVWLHVDGAWGGGVLMSRRHRHLLEGVERADSITWNPHKLLSVPQQCSVFLTKHEGLLQAAHSAQASYLFQPDKFYDVSYDTGDKTFQCGRKVDVFKFWLMWKAKGTRGMEQHVNTLFDNTKYFVEKLRKRDSFKLLVPEPELTNVCFWYIPPCLRDVPEGPEFRARLHKVAPLIKERMIKKGSMMITYQPQKEHVNFFRLVLQSSGTTYEDMDFFLDEIERLGRDIVV